MTWRTEGKDLVWSGVENGVAPSPLKGTANIQNANISTETGEVMASFARFKEDQVAITNGTLTASVSDGAVLLDAPATLQAGQWITVSNSTIPGATASANFLVVGGGGGGGYATTSEGSGGGGGGGFETGSFTPTVTSYSVVVGDGGRGGTGTSADTRAASGEASYLGTALNIFSTLVVAGAGGGGNNGSTNSAGGGGGGGGVVQSSSQFLPETSYTITVGAGGAGGSGALGQDGASGSDSSIGTTIVARGGGGGGGVADGTAQIGLNGASGGGGGGSIGQGSGGLQIEGQGSAGGNGDGDGTPGFRAAGGGGGAGGTGQTASGGSGGNGGAGVTSSITGSAVTYGAGGGGGACSSTGGTGGSGAGNGGGDASGGNGTANRGGGGGGGGGDTGAVFTGGNGGSGVVIIRFPTASINVTDSTGATSTTVGSDTVLTWTGNGSFAFTYVASPVAYALGGGYGSSPNSGLQPGANGASGGGGSSGDVLLAGSGAQTQGTAGGIGSVSTGNAGGGGGGSTGAGSDAATGSIGGAGGAGTSSSISGTATAYAGGGGGGGNNGAGAGGTGGGGSGSAGATPTDGTNGLGGGGGGNYGLSSAKSGGSGGSGIVIISYVTGTMTATGGAITFAGGNTIHTFTSDGTFTVQSIATAGQYFVSYKNSSNKIKLSAIFDPYGLYPIAHGTSGTATFSTLAVPAAGLAKATEQYCSATDTFYRYYLLDTNSRVWVYDTQVYASTLANNGVGEAWMLPDPADYSSDNFTGLAILNGWCLVINNSQIEGKPTVDLGRAFAALDHAKLVNPFATHTNFAYVGHQGKMYYCDGNYIGELFPTTSLATSLANVQSYSSFTGSGTTGTLTAVITGSSPNTLDGSGAIARIPVVFFATQTTSLPPGIVADDVYWVKVSSTNTRQFEVYDAQSGGSPLTITTAGTCYFNTFYPFGNEAGINGTEPLVQFSPQRVNLPVFETAQCMVEAGNTILIGGVTNTLYPWNQIDATPSDLIALPEANVTAMLNVNNMAYVFAGNKGNIYISNGSTASLILKVPDYCAGVPGTPNSYIEPRFTWGDAIFVRGRVYFSILDQTSTKVGNCGGVWSFVPPQNFFYGQDTGVALRLENQNSYGSYSGMATILIANEEQNALGAQYWSSWQNSYSLATSTSFGIDQTDDIPVTTYVIETDLIPAGTFLSKTTLEHFEYKLATPFASGDSIALFWRKNATAAWTALTNQITETSTVSGYYTSNLEDAQWIQLRAEVTTNASTTSSFGRLTELRIR